MMFSRRFCLRLLIVAFAAIGVMLAIAPHDRADWALENFLAAPLGEDAIARMWRDRS